jgi:membrane protease YdiL (CAAX protease family)
MEADRMGQPRALDRGAVQDIGPPFETPQSLHYGPVADNKLTWRPAPGWPEAPPGWQPPPGWSPPPDWPPAPPGWAFWVPDDRQPVAPVRLTEPTRRDLVLETWLVMLALLLPWVTSAVLTLVLHLETGASLTQLPSYAPHHPAANIVVGLLSYLPVAAVVPLAVLLLARTGQRPAELGLTSLQLPDFGAAVGLAAAAYGCELVLAVPLIPLVRDHSALLNTAGSLHVPVYYLVFGLSMSLITAVAEEVAVNGYLLTRLDQLGWSPGRALVLSLVLRTSYHVYYGIGLILTLPFGYFVTRSFQKHRKLARPILAHFLYDAVTFTIAILVH